MTRVRVFMLVLTFVVLGIFGSVLILYARGYRFDINEERILAKNGLLVVNSDPNGAQVFIEGELETATNNTITLNPGKHAVLVRKEGFLNWEKEVEIIEEEVTQINAFLLPVAPSLSALTFSGAFNPVLSMDQAKVAYGVLPSAEEDTNGGEENDRSGLWVLEMGNLPLGFSRDPRQILRGDIEGAQWEFSPDGRNILLTLDSAVYLLQVSETVDKEALVDISLDLEKIKEEWERSAGEKLEGQLGNLKTEMREIFEASATNILFSPDETKILYTASSSASIPEGIVNPLPGASTQKQKRDIEPGEIYVYDIREDRNFLVENSSEMVYWLQNSLNLLVPRESAIEILDYDGANRQVVFSGGFVYPFVFPSTSSGRLIILTNLGATGAPNNLYWLGLK